MRERRQHDTGRVRARTLVVAARAPLALHRRRQICAVPFLFPEPPSGREIDHDLRMSKPTAEEVRNSPLITAADIENRVRDLIAHAIVRKIWLLLLDAERVQLPVLMPIEGLPDRPTSGASMGPFLKAVCGEPTKEVVVVWERPGGPQLRSADREWLRFVAAGLMEAGLGSAGMVLSHTKGTRWLPGSEWT